MTTKQQLEQFAGSDTAKHAVLRLAQRQNVAAQCQAVLLYGPEKSYTERLALLLAECWLCQSPGEDGACGECQSCVSLGRGRHIDLLRVEPQPPSHLIRLQTVASDDGSIQSFLQTYPMMARNKVVVMLEADRMIGDAANAFLKTLEEPPELGRIVLTSQSPSMLLPTILSRCLSIVCGLDSAETMEPLAAAWGDLAVFLENSAAKAEMVERHRAEYQSILSIASRLVTAQPEEALGLSEAIRETAEKWEKRAGNGMRDAYAEVLRALAVAMRLGAPHQIEPVIEAHRRIIGNGNATLILDGLVSSLLAGH